MKKNDKTDNAAAPPCSELAAVVASPELGPELDLEPGPELGRPGAPLMYVGPTLREPISLHRGMVFHNNLPRLLAEALSADADLAALFLPLGKAGPAMRALQRGQGPLAGRAKAVLKRGGKQ